jgi:tripartite ATP-independent transporter DctP family solute receptor
MSPLSRRYAVALAATVLGVALAGPAAAQTTLRLGHSLAKGHPVDVSLQEFAQLVSERSQGDMEVKVFPGGQLGQQRELIEQMQNGAIDLVHANASPLAAFEPSYGVYDMPFLFRDSEHFFKVVEGPAGEEILKSSEPKAFVGLAYYDNGTRSFYSNKPLPKPEDIKGLKVRVQPGPIATRMVDLMGATATPLPWGEVYTALQAGVVDGAENNVTALTLARHGEVMKVYTRTEHTRVPDVLLIATMTLDQLTPEQQTLLRQAARDSATAHNARWKAELDKAESEASTKLGVTFVDADRAAYRQVVQPMYDELKATPALATLAEHIQSAQ